MAWRTTQGRGKRIGYRGLFGAAPCSNITFNQKFIKFIQGGKLSKHMYKYIHSCYMIFLLRTKYNKVYR